MKRQPSTEAKAELRNRQASPLAGCGRKCGPAFVTPVYTCNWTAGCRLGMLGARPSRRRVGLAESVRELRSNERLTLYVDRCAGGTRKYGTFFYGALTNCARRIAVHFFWRRSPPSFSPLRCQRAQKQPPRIGLNRPRPGRAKPSTSLPCITTTPMWSPIGHPQNS